MYTNTKKHMYTNIERRLWRNARGLLGLLVVLSMVLAACNGVDSPDAAPDTTAPDTTAPDEPDTTPAPAPPGEPGGTLRVVYDSEPPTWDPYGTPIQAMHTVGIHVYEGLFTVDADNQPIPMLADDFTYDEGTKTATINLRQGVVFHNGKEMTVEDVIASLELWMEDTAYGSTLSANVADLRAVDDYTLEIEFVENQGNWPFFLAYPHQQAPILPSEVIAERGDDGIPESGFIGTGPFQWDEFAPNQYVRITRFDGYVGRTEAPDGHGGSKLAPVDAIEFIPVPEVTVRQDMLATGQADIALFLSPEMHDVIDADPNLEPLVKTPDRFAFLVVNKLWGPLADVDVRRAFTIALDMDEIMAGAFGDPTFWRTDPSMIFQEFPHFWSEAGSEDTYNQGDTERARQILEEAGYDGEEIIWLTTREGEWGFDAAVIAVQQLERAGFNIDLRVTDFTTIVSVRDTVEGEWHVFSNNSQPTSEPGIYPLFDENWAGWWIDEVKDELLLRLNSTIDPDERKVVWDQLQARLWDQVGWIKLGDYFGLDAQRSNVQGYQNHRYPFFWGVSIDG